MTSPILEIKNLDKHFPIGGSWFGKQSFVYALNDISLIVYEGETLGVVGESGCGKSTLARCVLRLLEPSKGEVYFQGKDLSQYKNKELKKARKEMQMVFQNPFDTLNPKSTIRKILSEPLIAHNIPKEKRNKLIEETIEIVGLRKEHLDRNPHEFSGGQRQRISIARALMLRPKLIVADEAVSALDVSIQAQILNLLQDLQEEFELTYIFISHDLSVVEHVSDRVAVMYLGKIVELARKEVLFEKPLHPYTEALLSAVPSSEPNKKQERILLVGDLPSLSNPPKGCKFHPCCHACMDICKTVEPVLKEVDGRSLACHLY